jgi:hypothetical protein
MCVQKTGGLGGEGEEEVMFDVYDECWKMHNNKPVRYIVYAVCHEMDFQKAGVKTFLMVVRDRCGACWDTAVRVDIKDLFPTKQDLINSL